MANGKQGKVDDDWKAPKEMPYRQFDSVSAGQREAKPIASLQVRRYGFVLDLLFWAHGDKLKITPFESIACSSSFYSHFGIDQTSLD